MIVLDASTAVGVTTGAVTAPAILDQLDDESVVAPELLWVEVASALRHLLATEELDTAGAHTAVALLRALDVTTYGHEGLTDRVLELRHSITAYDATYVALAEMLGCPLVTCDARLAGSHGHSAVVILERH